MASLLPALNLPNKLTLARLGMCGLLLVSMSVSWRYGACLALLIFSVASLTDWLDGEIARRRNLVTDLGKLLDPLADKILITGTLVSLVQRGVAPMWMVVVIIAREFLITGLRTIAAHKQKILAAERVGKHKTVSQIVAIIVSLVFLSFNELGWGNSLLGHLLGLLQTPLYWIALIITVLSGAFYFRKNAAILSETMQSASEKPAPSAVSLSSPAPISPVAQPAFKEWEAIVEALGQGAQILILRKGGIAEGRGGFQAKHDKFWLFPTRFHQQWEKSKPALRDMISPSAETGPDFILRYFAEVTDTAYLDSWDQVERLNGFHFWGDEILRNRFGYDERPGMQAGLHLFIVRVHRTDIPHRLAPAKAYEGCRSWIEVPLDWPAAHPIMTDNDFAIVRDRILAAAKPLTPAPTAL